MPNRQHTHQVKAADSTVGYSPRLCNEDLAPTRDQKLELVQHLFFLDVRRP